MPVMLESLPRLARGAAAAGADGGGPLAPPMEPRMKTRFSRSHDVCSSFRPIHTLARARRAVDQNGGGPGVI